ncbi:MAG: hypothetical protein ACRYFX_18860 [Janthinobacterium lividum]
MPVAPPTGSSATVPGIANTTVAMPRQNAAALFLDDLSGYNPLVRKEDNPELEPYYKDFNIIQALDFAGREKRIMQLVYRNYEQGQWFNPPTPASVTGATTTGTTGGTVTMTLTAGSFSPRRTNTSTGSVALYSSLQKNDYVYFYNGLSALITAETGTQGTNGITYTVTRADGNSADIAAAIQYHVTNSIPLATLSNAYAEGSLQPFKGLEKENVYYQNQVQTVKTHRASTGDVDTMEVIDINGVTRIGAKQWLEMTEEHKIKVMQALWWGKGETYQDPSEALPLVRVTKGVDQSIRERGITYRFSLANGFTTADGDAVLSQLEVVRGGKEYQIWAGSDAYAYWQAYFAAKVAGLPAQVYSFNSFGQSNGKEKAFDVGATSVIIRGITLHLMRGDMLNIQGMTDIAGYNFSYLSYLVPGELQAVGGNFTDPSNGKTATSIKIPSLEAVYTTDAKNNMRKWKQWERGPEITNRDQTDRELLTQVGARLTYGRKFVIVIGQ